MICLNSAGNLVWSEVAICFYFCFASLQNIYVWCPQRSVKAFFFLPLTNFSFVRVRKKLYSLLSFSCRPYQNESRRFIRSVCHGSIDIKVDRWDWGRAVEKTRGILFCLFFFPREKMFCGCFTDRGLLQIQLLFASYFPYFSGMARSTQQHGRWFQSFDNLSIAPDGRPSEKYLRSRSVVVIIFTDPQTGVAPGKPEAAMCVRNVDVQCVLQFTLIHAFGCVLHRPMSRVIHRSELSYIFLFCR